MQDIFPPHPFIDFWALWIGVPLALLGLWAAWARRGEDSPLPADGLREQALMASLALCAYCGLRSVVGLNVVALVGGDEYCRADYSFQWAQAPFFAPHDHIWPAGQFYALGTLYRWIPNMPLVVDLTALAGTGLLVLLCADVARRVWGSPAAGFFAGLFVASHKVILWGSFNPFAEVFALPALMAAFDAWLVGWLLLREAPKPAPSAEGEAEGAPVPAPAMGPELWFLAAGACAAFGTMFRYELWFAGIALGMFLGFRSLWILWRGPSRSRALPLLGGCALLMAYPVGWMISCWKTLGSPVQFLSDASRMNVEGNAHGFYDFSSPLSMFLTYPKVLWLDHWPWLLPALAGLAMAAMGSRWRKKPLALAGAWLAVMAVSMAATAKSGIGSNYRPRYTTFFALPLICLAAGPMAALWDWLPGKKGLALRGLVAGLAFWLALGAANVARREYPNAWGMSAGTLGLAVRLDRENEPHRRGMDVLWPEGTALHIYLGSGAPERLWMVRYHSGRPWQAGAQWTPEQLLGALGAAAEGTRFLIPKAALPGLELPARAKRLEDASPLELWTVEGPPAP